MPVVDDDDPPCQLSATTMSALQEFLRERQAAEEAAAEDPFAENWGLSQVGACACMMT